MVDINQNKFKEITEGLFKIEARCVDDLPQWFLEDFFEKALEYAFDENWYDIFVTSNGNIRVQLGDWSHNKSFRILDVLESIKSDIELDYGDDAHDSYTTMRQNLLCLRSKIDEAVQLVSKEIDDSIRNKLKAWEKLLDGCVERHMAQMRKDGGCLT